MLLTLPPTLLAGAKAHELEVLQQIAHRTEGDARWSEAVERGVNFGFCDDPKCAMFYLSVRNESDDALQCNGDLDVSGMAGMLREQIYSWADGEQVIQPGSKADLVEYRGDATATPRKYTVRCRLARPSALSIPTGCTAEFPELKRLADFYPPGSIRRRETGHVTVEFTLAAGSGPGSDVMIAGSSGIPPLDAAALRLMREVSFGTRCPGERFSRTLHFSIEEGRSLPGSDTSYAFGFVIPEWPR